MEKLDNEKLQNIVNMLQSTDQENRVVALTLLEEVNFENNIAFMLLVKKHSNVDNKTWEEHAPETFGKLAALPGLDINRALTFKHVVEVLGKMKAPVEDLIFFTEDFNRYLAQQYRALGYDFIKDIKTEIKFADNYETTC